MTEKSKRFIGVAIELLMRPGSIRIAMLAVIVVAAAGILFTFVSSLYANREDELLHELAQAQQERVATEAHASLEQAAEHLTLLRQRLAEHKDGAAPFRLIAEHLDPEVGFSAVTIDYAVPEIRFSVHGPNAGSIARQHAAFENDDRIVSVDVSPLSRERENGRYEAEMRVRLAPDILLAFPDVNEHIQ